MLVIFLPFKKKGEKFSLKLKALKLYKEGVKYPFGHKGASDAPDPLLKPPSYPLALAGARPINTQKVLRLKFWTRSFHSLKQQNFLTPSNFFAYCLINLQLICKLYDLIRLQQVETQLPTKQLSTKL